MVKVIIEQKGVRMYSPDHIEMDVRSLMSAQEILNNIADKDKAKVAVVITLPDIAEEPANDQV